MEGLRHYFFGLICAALLCSIISSFVKNSAYKAIMKLLCGIFLTIELVQPFLRADIKIITETSANFMQDGQRIAERGKDMAQDALSCVIESELEAYVLEKAGISSEDLALEITLNSDYVPVSARITGNESSQVQAQLETILEADLGITKENQIWSGRK